MRIGFYLFRIVGLIIFFGVVTGIAFGVGFGASAGATAAGTAGWNPFGFLLAIFVLILLFGLFGTARRHNYHYYGGWNSGPGNVSQNEWQHGPWSWHQERKYRRQAFFDDWHRRAHESMTQPPAQGQQPGQGQQPTEQQPTQAPGQGEQPR